MNRREFISGGLTMAAATAVGATNPLKAPKTPIDKLIWGVRCQLGVGDQCGARTPLDSKYHLTGELRAFNEADFWKWIDLVKATDANTIVMAVMEGMKYPRRPDIAPDNAIEAGRLHDILKRVREEHGLATIPELNFSTRHGAWFGVYSRMVSSPTYYKAVEDVLADVYDVFGHPKYIQYGMDEESNEGLNASYNVVRLKDVYWHDNRHVVETIERLGAQAWCYSDKIWWGAKEFCDNMPKSVLQSNWYYSSACTVDEIRALAAKAKDKHLGDLFCGYLRAFEQLEAGGFEQIPTGSYWLDRLDKAAGYDWKYVAERNFPNVVRDAVRTVDPKRLKGFLLALWAQTNGPAWWKERLTPVPLARQAYGDAET